VEPATRRRCPDGRALLRKDRVHAGRLVVVVRFVGAAELR
jgi:hypothetical protein